MTSVKRPWTVWELRDRTSEELQKQLDALLGKSEKGLKDLLSKREAALKALLEEQKRLREEFNRAELQSLKDAGQARAQEQLRQDYNAIAQLEKTLKEKEAAYRKVGGTGTQAEPCTRSGTGT